MKIDKTGVDKTKSHWNVVIGNGTLNLNHYFHLVCRYLECKKYHCANVLRRLIPGGGGISLKPKSVTFGLYCFFVYKDKPS